MKKTILLLFILIIGLFSIAVNAQWLWDLIDSLWSEISFWYTTVEKITIKEITDEKVVIQSPLIKNQNNQNISNYTLMYSEFPLTEILENTNLLNETKEKTITLTGSEDPFHVELWIPDWLNPITKYYLFIIPKDDTGNLWEVSNEIWFNISTKTYWDAWSSEVYTLDETHDAAWADMTLANISHEINWNTITLKRIAVNWSETIDLSVMTPGSSSFNRVATVNMNQETYAFTSNRNWEYIFKFTPDNNWKEINYSLQMNTTIIGWNDNNWGWWTVIPVVPKTWPKENAIVIIIAAFLWYVIYRKLYRKAK